MDEHNHSDSNDPEESSKVLLKWYILHIHHYWRINFIVKNRAWQAVVPRIFLSITTPALLLWNLKWCLQQDKKNSQILWCYQDTRQCQKASHAREICMQKFGESFLWNYDLPEFNLLKTLPFISVCSDLKLRKTYLQHVQIFKMKSW